jgi:hypothetical protein
MIIVVIIIEIGIGWSSPVRRVGGYVGQRKERRFSDTQNGRSVEQHIANAGIAAGRQRSIQSTSAGDDGRWALTGVDMKRDGRTRSDSDLAVRRSPNGCLSLSRRQRVDSPSGDLDGVSERGTQGRLVMYRQGNWKMGRCTEPDDERLLFCLSNV